MASSPGTIPLVLKLIVYEVTVEKSCGRPSVTVSRVLEAMANRALRSRPEESLPVRVMWVLFWSRSVPVQVGSAYWSGSQFRVGSVIVRDVQDFGWPVMI